MDEVTTMAVAGVAIAGMPFYVMAATAAATTTVKLVKEAFGSATEKQIEETTTPPI
jgi:hypothetical protein